MPKLCKIARVFAAKLCQKRKIVDSTEDQLKAAIDIDVPIMSSYWRDQSLVQRDQSSVQPSFKTIINFDQMITT